MRYKEEHTSLWCDRNQPMATNFVWVVWKFHNYNYLRIEYARITNSTPSWAYTQADIDGCFHLFEMPSVWSSQELYLLHANQCTRGEVAPNVKRCFHHFGVTSANPSQDLSPLTSLQLCNCPTISNTNLNHLFHIHFNSTKNSVYLNEYGSPIAGVATVISRDGVDI